MSPALAPSARRRPISGMRCVVFCHSTPNRPKATITSKKAAITDSIVNGIICVPSIDLRPSGSGVTI